MTRVKKIKKKMNAGGCSSIMGGAENKKKERQGARVGLVCNRVWAGSTHEPRVGSGGV